MSTKVVAEAVDVPVRPAQQPLHPVRRDLTRPLRKHLPVLAVQPCNQIRRKPGDPLTRLSPTEPGLIREHRPIQSMCGKILAMTGENEEPGLRQSQQSWTVALSFAGTARSYVQQVADALARHGVRCFYDADEQVDLWGKYLTEELPRIYTEDSAVVVVFISADYIARDWTRLERRSALNRAARERREFLLPVRLDDTHLPGLLSDMVAISASSLAPESLAEIIIAKLSRLGLTTGAHAAARHAIEDRNISHRQLFGAAPLRAKSSGGKPYLASIALDMRFRPGLRPNTSETVPSVVGALAFAPGSSLLAIGSDEGTTQVWDLESIARPIRTSVLHGSSGRISAIRYAPDGQWLAVGGADSSVHIWKTAPQRTPEVVATLSDQGGAIYAMAVSPDSRWLATAGQGSTIRVRDMAILGRPTVVVELPGHSRSVNTMHFSHDGRWMATAGSDAEVRIWAMADPRCPTIAAVVTAHRKAVQAIRFAPGDRHMVSVGDDGDVYLWDTTRPASGVSGERIGEQPGPIYTAEFSTDGRWLATAGDDGKLYLRDTMPLLREVAMGVSPDHFGPIYASASSHDGAYLATGGAGGVVLIWRFR